MTERKTIHDHLAQWGSLFSPDMIQGTQSLFAELVPRPDESQVVRDLAYGPHERHRLDIFSPPGAKAAPVLLFVHGGGFVMGDKGAPDAPFHNNIGAWAMRQGFVGATMTYRLAPQHGWPAGREDLIAAVGWLKAHSADHGGDPARIFVMGQSAGATHVADLVAEPGTAAGQFAGAMMISGLYDISQAERNDFHRAYYGDDEGLYAERSTIGKLATTRTPCLYSVSEYDPPDFQRQATALVGARVTATEYWPEMHWLAGHNHLSSVSQIGSEHDSLGPLVADFIARHG